MHPQNLVIAENLVNSIPLLPDQNHVSIIERYLGDQLQQYANQEEQNFRVPNDRLLPSHNPEPRNVIYIDRNRQRENEILDQRQAQRQRYHRYVPYYRPQIGHQRRRKEPKPQGLDHAEIEALSSIQFKASRAQQWDDVNKKCSICISQFEELDKIRFLPCLHRFHSNCVDSWLSTKGTCPLCKNGVRELVLNQ